MVNINIAKLLQNLCSLIELVKQGLINSFFFSSQQSSSFLINFLIKLFVLEFKLTLSDLLFLTDLVDLSVDHLQRLKSWLHFFWHLVDIIAHSLLKFGLVGIFPIFHCFGGDGSTFFLFFLVRVLIRFLVNLFFLWGNWF